MLITIRIWFWLFIECCVWHTSGTRLSILKQQRWAIRLAKIQEKEQLALERVKLQDAKSNPVLLITLLNANLPHKYRPTVVMNDDTAKSVLHELRKMAKDTPQTEDTEEEEVSALEQVNEILHKKLDNDGGMA